MKTCSPLRRANAASLIFVLALVLSAGLFAPNLHADQTVAEATAILTAGSWHFVGHNTKHRFMPDGQVICQNYSPGRWEITDGVLVVSLTGGDAKCTIPLPIGDQLNGVLSGGQPMTLVHSVKTDSAPEAQASPETPEPAATPTPPIPADTQQAAAQVVQNYRDSLVFVTGADGAGSGFIASMAGSNFLITNAHVAAGIRDAQFKTLDGTAVEAGVPSLAVGEDIFCMLMPAGGKPFQIMQNVDQNAAIGDSVVVLGNAEGGGVVNTIIGKIVGIGPNLVEIDAPFVPGNSGSPIVHLKSGKVIGVATYLEIKQYDMTTNKILAKPVVRRFGYRIDSVKGWQAVNWQGFNAQAVQMESIEKLTDDLDDFFQDLDEHKGVVTMGRHTNPVISTRIDDWIAAKSNHPSAEDSAEADANFLSFLKIACQTDITAAQRSITYDYFRRELTDQKQARDEMSKDFQQIINSVQN
jgi:hypothetical protein